MLIADMPIADMPIADMPIADMIVGTLKKSQDFATVQRHGKRFVRDNVIVVRHENEDSGVETRIGYIVSRKCGNAVRRNRIKRRLRAAMKEIGNHYAGDYVIIGRYGAYNCPFTELSENLHDIFKDKVRP